MLFYPVTMVLNTGARPPADGLVFGVDDSPAEALDKLCCRVLVLEVIRVDGLVKQNWAVRSFALIRRNDDSGHHPSLGLARALPPIGRASTHIDGPQTTDFVTLDE
jgi:hypothetical protein